MKCHCMYCESGQFPIIADMHAKMLISQGKEMAAYYEKAALEEARRKFDVARNAFTDVGHFVMEANSPLPKFVRGYLGEARNVPNN